MDCFRYLRVAGTVLTLVLVSQAGKASTTKHRKVHPASTPAVPAKSKSVLASKSVRTPKTLANVRAASYTSTGVTHAPNPIFSTHHRRSLYSPWTEPTFADSSAGDSIEGEDPVVRKA